MSYPTAAAVAAQPVPTPEPPARQCIDKDDKGVECKRRVTWFIERVGHKCNLHFDQFFDKYWRTTPVDSIRRLSDNERDFSEYKPSGLGGRPRKHPLPESTASAD